MVSRITIILLIATLLSIGCRNQTKNSVQESVSLDKEIENVVLQSQAPTTTFTSNINKPYIGLSYAIHYKGKDYYYNYGETKLGNKIKPTKESLYEIGSITKTFTSLLLAKAVIDGKVKLSDQIIKYLPDSLKRNSNLRSITLLTLANHTSGLPRLPVNLKSFNSNPSQPDNYNEEAVFSSLKNYIVKDKPGTRFLYSNLAYNLLGIILERVYRTPYQTLLKESVTEPLKLTQTKIKVPKEEETLLVQGYNQNNKEAPAWEQHLKGAGAIISNTSDLLVYGKAQLPNANNGLTGIIALTQEKTFPDDSISIGLAWHLLSSSQDKVIMHTGRTGGGSSFIAVDLTKSIVVVILSNKSMRQQELGLRLLNLLSKK